MAFLLYFSLAVVVLCMLFGKKNVIAWLIFIPFMIWGIFFLPGLVGGLH